MAALSDIEIGLINRLERQNWNVVEMSDINVLKRIILQRWDHVVDNAELTLSKNSFVKYTYKACVKTNRTDAILITFDGAICNIEQLQGGMDNLMVDGT